MPHFGSKENPAEISNPGDLDRAVARVWHPTAAQAAAGNYKQAHVIVGGLHIAIETPKHRMRTGVGPDGVTWSVQMPAHYGAVKRTKGADGDAVDVYLGDDSHQAYTLPVWIVDQIDADSREWDEHKCLCGFSNVESAKQAYLNAFSDGKGPQRVGAVARFTFDEFKNWLKSESTKKPILYKKSASTNIVSKHYCSNTCSCQTGKSGGFMATTESTTPSAIGKLTGILSKALGRMTPDERAVIFADAGVQASDALSKAGEEMLRHGDDGGSPGRVEDQWDGAPDDALEVGGGHGPESTAAPGKVNVGPSQMASGNGALKMEREYSRHAPQGGVQLATEKLGRDLAGMKGAMKSILKAMEAFNVQIETVKAGIATAPVLPDLDKMIADAVAKAIAPAVSKAVAKAVADITISKAEDEEEDEKEDKEAAKAESEFEKEEDDDGEDDKESAKSKSAAQLRGMAKSRLAWAEKRLAKAIEFAEVAKADKCEKMYALAQINLSKAAGYVESAKAIRGEAGPATKALVKSITKLDKAIKAAPVDNQKIWPASTEKTVGKAVETAPTQADLAKSMSEVQKALEGVGILQASMKQMFDVVSGQSRLSSGGQNLPPVLSLAKGGLDSLTSRQAEIIRMAETGVIKMDDVDRANDVISLLRTNAMPEKILAQKLAKLPVAVQDVLNRVA